MSESAGYNLLHKNVQRWIWAQNWTGLRDIQERSIEPILSANCDVIISASTAAGKTEAAFLPACSRIVETKVDGVGILYISPLKALINDQYRRLQSLGEILDIPVTPWHGEVSQALKNVQKKNPSGIILITPESLESMLLNRGPWCIKAFASLSHIIIDEFHAFLGSERGCQLQSLMHRIEYTLGRTVPRIALSATLNDMEQVARYLRPSSENFPYTIIESSASTSELKIQLRGYLNRANDTVILPTALTEISNDLYRVLRGKSHLIFANSRKNTEELAAKLKDLCEQNNVPNEFFPHHGSLAKELREELEARLQENKLPNSAVCTMTLELGIDIGSVDSIAQVTAAHSVASLRQRVGRSGRRGDPAVLRFFIPEDEITAKSDLLDCLRLETVQSIAMINLLLQKWCEPAPDKQYHLSTLVQQSLSVVAQYGGVRANQLWTLLCENGPFALVDQNLYAKFLKALGEHDLITQMQDGQLVLGTIGEGLVEDYKFYAAFSSSAEYRLECEGRSLGVVPISQPLMAGQLIVFAGKHWEVLDINWEKKLITLKSALGGKPPDFGGSGQSVHDRVRQEMRRIYIEKSIPTYLDKTAREMLAEGIACFHTLGLTNISLLKTGTTVRVLSWLGDQITNTISVLLRQEGLTSNCIGGVIDIRNSTVAQVYTAIRRILDNKPLNSEDLGSCVLDTVEEKHDRFIPKELRDMAYGRKHFDVPGALKWMAESVNDVPSLS